MRFKQEKVVRLGDTRSPNILTIYLQRVMQRRQESAPGIKIHGSIIGYLKFGNDMDLIEKNLIKLQESPDMLTKTAIEYRLVVNINRTIVMVFDRKSLKNNIRLNVEEVETANRFACLESLLSIGGCKK